MSDYTPEQLDQMADELDNTQRQSLKPHATALRQAARDARALAEIRAYHEKHVRLGCGGADIHRDALAELDRLTLWRDPETPQP